MYLIANGGVLGYPKNIKESVLLSKFDDNVDGVLIDVRMTDDGKLVLHESDLIFKDNYISKMSYQDIRKFKIGDSLNNYYIPLLEEILLYYEKDLLIINLHHNYDKNEELVSELNRILKKYYLKRVVIVTNNDNLFDYLNLLTDYEIYNLNNNDSFINIDVISKNYNSNLINNIVSKDKKDLENFNNSANNNFNNMYVITNNPKSIKNYY